MIDFVGDYTGNACKVRIITRLRKSAVDRWLEYWDTR